MKIGILAVFFMTAALGVWAVTESWVSEKEAVIFQIKNANDSAVKLGIGADDMRIESGKIDDFAEIRTGENGYLLSNLRPSEVFYRKSGMRVVIPCFGTGTILKINISERSSCNYYDGNLTRIAASMPLIIASLPEKLSVVFNPFYR